MEKYRVEQSENKCLWYVVTEPTMSEMLLGKDIVIIGVYSNKDNADALAFKKNNGE
jgi:hypothetical protein